MAEEDLTTEEAQPPLLRRTEEGYPYLQAEPDTPVGDDPFAKSAERVRARHPTAETKDFLQPGRSDWSQAIPEFGKGFVEGAKRSAPAQIQSIDEALAGHYVPEGAASYGDGDYYDKDGNVLPKQRKPFLDPRSLNPNTGETEWVVPGVLDVINTIGNPVKGAATLGVGPIRRAAPGLGHNQGPLMGPPPSPGVPPPPAAAPPPLVPSGRQIIRGHDPAPPMTWDKVYTQTIDNLHPLKVLQGKIAEHGALLPGEESYELARLTRGSYGRTQQALNNSTWDYHTLADNGPPLKKILEPVKDDLDSFENFAVAMRDVEKLQQGIPTGVTLAEAQNVIAGAPPHFLPALRRLHSYQDKLLQYMHDSGIVSSQAVTAMRAANRDYVPFYRLVDAPEYGTSARNIRTNNPIKGMTGSSRDILSPIESIIRNTHKMIDLAEKNRALNALVDSAEVRGLHGLVEKVHPGTHPVNVSKAEVEKYLADNGIALPPHVVNAMVGAPDTFQIFRPNPFRPEPDQIAVWKNGKRQIYRVDPEVAEAVNGMSREQLSQVMEMASVPARMLRAGVVLTPEFMVKNMLRDQLMAATQSRDGYIPFLGYVQGLRAMFPNSSHRRTYELWLKSGGANVALTNLERKYLQGQIESMFDSGWLDALKRNAKNPLQLLEKMQEFSEHPTRIGAFEKALQKGKTPHQAGYVSREVSTDFARRGASEGLMSFMSTIPFSRATVQGLDRLVREFHAKPAATSFKIAALISVPTLGFYYRNRQDPRIFDIPKEERRLFWHEMQDDWRPVTKEQAANIPDRYKKKEGDQHYMNVGSPLRSPKPFEAGFFFGSTLEMALDKFFSEHPEIFKDITGKDFPKQSEPFDGWLKGAMSSSMPGFVPQILLTPIEAVSNYSFFRERPIVPKHLQSPENRKYEYTPFTTETAKYMASILSNVMPEHHLSSPLVIENYARGLAGTMGVYTLQAADEIMRQGKVAAGKDVPEKPESELPDYPFIRAFVSRLPSTASRPVTEFYKNLENSRTTKALINRVGREAALDPEDRKAAQREIISERSAVNMARTSKAIGVQMKLIQRIMADKKMTGPDKTKLIQITTLSIIMMADRANAVYNADKARKVQQPQPVQ